MYARLLTSTLRRRVRGASGRDRRRRQRRSGPGPSSGARRDGRGLADRAGARAVDASRLRRRESRRPGRPAPRASDRRDRPRRVARPEGRRPEAARARAAGPRGPVPAPRLEQLEHPRVVARGSRRPGRRRRGSAGGSRRRSPRRRRRATRSGDLGRGPGADPRHRPEPAVGVVAGHRDDLLEPVRPRGDTPEQVGSAPLDPDRVKLVVGDRGDDRRPAARSQQPERTGRRLAPAANDAAERRARPRSRSPSARGSRASATRRPARVRPSRIPRMPSVELGHERVMARLEARHDRRRDRPGPGAASSSGRRRGPRPRPRAGRRGWRSAMVAGPSARPGRPDHAARRHAHRRVAAAAKVDAERPAKVEGCVRGSARDGASRAVWHGCGGPVAADSVTRPQPFPVVPVRAYFRRRC